MPYKRVRYFLCNRNDSIYFELFVSCDCFEFRLDLNAPRRRTDGKQEDTVTTGELVREHVPVTAPEGERPALERLKCQLGSGSGSARILSPTGDQIEIPPTVFAILTRAVEYMAHGDAVTLVPYHQVVTTQEAADLLNMSRPSVIRLLDDGALPYTRFGKHRRLKLQDVLEYKRRRSFERKEGLKELTRLSQDYGLYE